MAKLTLMFSTDTGWERVGESQNGGGPAPVKKFGMKVGACHAFGHNGKRVFNRQLSRANYTRHELTSSKHSLWTHRDGSAIEADHRDGHVYTRRS